MENKSEEPSTAPEPGEWYNIELGSSFKDHQHHSDHSPKFCTLRYKFKPASVDSSQPGLLHKSKDNRVTVEFQNNQQGKPKVIFDGVGEDYGDNDAILFFDGEMFRLEQLHRAVKRLRHVRLPGEPLAAAASTMTTSVVSVVESYSTPSGKGSKLQSSNTGVVTEPTQLEQIEVGNSTSVEAKGEKDVDFSPCLPNPSTLSPDEPEENVDIIDDNDDARFTLVLLTRFSLSGAEAKGEKDVYFSPCLPNPSTLSPDEPEENVDIIDDNDDGCETAKGGNTSAKESHTGLDIDINLPHQTELDDEIADVDVSDDEADKGPNAAEALRAQVNAGGGEEQSSSSSSSSDSESTGTESGSGSGSGSESESESASTSTGSESSDGDSVNSI